MSSVLPVFLIIIIIILVSLVDWQNSWHVIDRFVKAYGKLEDPYSGFQAWLRL